MKIDNVNNPFLIQKKDSAKGAAASKGNLVVGDAPKAKAGDTVNLSDKSRLVAKATELAILAPDIRSEKVADLTAKIASGNYKVSSLDVADSLIRKGISSVI
ncbi:MAG: flagellar biosynthesis anti-sigma factor FlgM [Deltaproteobacteria bacterium]|jgi:flagellar biosynthesis anti-sigma factor FlgM|nr:flagellar biosynthesis anti-sigma factor FlgM [Deltaproteobacteria bacterium]